MLFGFEMIYLLDTRARGNDALLTIYPKGVRRGGLGFQLEYLGEEAGLVKN
jgi:hypothetical protein